MSIAVQFPDYADCLKKRFGDKRLEPDATSLIINWRKRRD